VFNLIITSPLDIYGLYVIGTGTEYYYGKGGGPGLGGGEGDSAEVAVYKPNNSWGRSEFFYQPDPDAETFSLEHPMEYTLCIIF